MFRFVNSSPPFPCGFFPLPVSQFLHTETVIIVCTIMLTQSRFLGWLYRLVSIVWSDRFFSETAHLVRPRAVAGRRQNPQTTTRPPAREFFLLLKRLDSENGLWNFLNRSPPFFLVGQLVSQRILPSTSYSSVLSHLSLNSTAARK